MDVVSSVLPNSKNAKLVAAAAVGLAAAAGLYFYQKTRPQLVGHVSRIIIYPIKSCKGLDVDEARCEKLGPESGGAEDRRYMIVSTPKNAFVTQRQYPELALVSPIVDDDDLVLHAPNMPELLVQHYYKWEGGWTSRNITVRKWNIMTEALDCGDEAAEWLGKYLNQRRQNTDGGSGEEQQQFRLVVYPREFGGITAQDAMTGGREFYGEPDDKAAFPDLAPYLLLNAASLDSLNNTLISHGKLPVAVENFRPNIVVEPVPGHERPYEEDAWEKLVIGDGLEAPTFRYYKPCSRCKITAVDSTTGTMRPDEEPLKTLKEIRQPKSVEGQQQFRSQGLFCLNLAPDRLGWIRVGDPVYAKIGGKFAEV